MSKVKPLKFEEIYKYKIKKSNYLCIAGIFDYTLYEYELSNYINSLIKPPTIDEDGKMVFQLEYEIDFDIFCEKNATPVSGKAYKYIHKALNGLMSKVIDVQMPNKAITGVHLIDRYEYKEGTGKGHIIIDDRMVPLLFATKDFVSYSDGYSYHFTSKYSGRVCDMLRAYMGRTRGGKINALKKRVNYKEDVLSMSVEDRKAYIEGYNKIKSTSYTIKMSVESFCNSMNIPKSIKGPAMIQSRILDVVTSDINNSSEIYIKIATCNKDEVLFVTNYKDETKLNKTIGEIEKKVNDSLSGKDKNEK